MRLLAVRGLAVLALVAAGALAARGAPRVGYNRGDLAPELTLNDQNENAVSLSSFLGQNVLLTFSAEWCGPCQAAAPNEEKVVSSLNNSGEPTTLVDVLVEDLYGDPSAQQDAQDWADSFNLTGPVLSCDGDDQSPGIRQFLSYSRLYGGPAYPTIVLLTPHGRIINVYLGFNYSKVRADFAQHRAYEPRCMVDWLMLDVEGLGSTSLASSLVQPLQGAMDALDNRDSTTACSQLGTFIDQVQAQSGTGLSADNAAQRIDAAQQIESTVGCP